MSDFEQFDDLDELEQTPPDAEGLGLLYAQDTRLSSEERAKKPKRKLSKGDNAPAATGIGVVKANLRSARADLEAAQELFDTVESLEQRGALSVAMSDLRNEIATLELEERVHALADTNPLEELALSYEASRDALDAYRASHESTYREDATYQRLRQETDEKYLKLEQTKADVATRDDRVQAAKMLEGYARSEADRAFRATLQDLQAQMAAAARTGNYVVSGDLQRQHDELARMVPERTQVWKAAYAEARTRIALEAQNATPDIPISTQAEAVARIFQDLPAS